MCGNAARQRQEQIQAGLIAPVQVFNDQDERLAHGEAGEDLHQRLDAAALLLLGVRRRIGRRVGQTIRQMSGEFRQQSDEHCGMLRQDVGNLVGCACTQPARSRSSRGA